MFIPTTEIEISAVVQSSKTVFPKVSAFPHPGGRQGTPAQVQRDAAWDQRLEELRLFAEANRGVANVPRDDPEHPALGDWCHSQVRRPPPLDNS